MTSANTPVNFTIPATDVEGDAIYYAGIVSPDNANLALTVDSATGISTLTPSNGIYGVYSIEVGVEPSTSDTNSSFDTQMVPVYIDPAAPTGIDLASSSDTGTSNSDNLTSTNAGLSFSVTGVISAQVSLYSDGTLIGQATASGTSVTIVTNASVTLTDGTHAITASQVLAGQAVNVGNLQTTVDLASTQSSALSVTVDTTKPAFRRHRPLPSLKARPIHTSWQPLTIPPAASSMPWPRDRRA